MSKSLERVKADATRLGLQIKIINTPEGTHTAQLAADFCACNVAQIAKSILFAKDDTLVMFITNGASRVDIKQAEKLTNAPLQKADAALIREVTGFAIGGVSPLGSIHPIPQFFDRKLMGYDEIYAAAGTPHALFQISPARLQSAIQAPISDFT